MRRLGLVVASLLGLTLACSSCKGRRDRGEIKGDPVVVDAREDTASPFVDRVLADGNVVDLRKTTLACKVSDELPASEASDGARAYLVGRDGFLRAFDLGCQGELWHVHTAGCDQLVVAGGRVWCSTHGTLTAWATTTKLPPGSDVDAETEIPKLATASAIAQIVAVGPRLFVFHESGALEIFEAGKLSPIATASFPIRPYGRSSFVATVDAKGACGTRQKGKDFELVCLDELGNVRFTKLVVIAKPTDPPFTSYYERANDGRYLLLSSLWSSAPGRAVVVRLSDGVEVARVEDEIAAVVARVEDGGVEGLLATKPSLRLLETNGATRWTATGLLRVEDSAVAMASGDRVFVVDYPQISSGASPFAFDRTSGKLLWAGALEQLEVAHSAYLNRVAISLHATDEGAVLAVRGSESMITYLQLFDVRSGVRKYSQARHTY